MFLIINFLITILLIIVGYFVGSMIEKKHCKSLIEREEEFSEIIVISSKYPPKESSNFNLEVGSVVISADRFKVLVGWLVGIFGGRISAYETLLDRARREAVLRLKEKAYEYGFDMIVNLKFETANISMSAGKSSAIFEVLAYGTLVNHKQ